MPNQPRADNPNRRFRCYDDDWHTFQALTAANGTKPSVELREFVKAYNKRHAKLLSQTSVETGTPARGL